MGLPVQHFYWSGKAYVQLCKTAQAHPISYSLAGKLQLSQSGWIVLTVPVALIRGVLDALHEPGAQLPPSFGIPVISPGELARIGGANKITERGHAVGYTLGPIRSHDASKVGISKVWYIQIASQDLKRIRHSYGLPPYPEGSGSMEHYQLPVAIRKSGVTQDNTRTKISGEINWNEFDEHAVKLAAAGVSLDSNQQELRRKRALDSLAQAAQLYHGSDQPNIPILEPRPANVINQEKAVFGTPNRALAISNIPKWRDSDFEQGQWNDKPWHMKEQYPGAIDKILKGSKGYLYSLPKDQFTWDPRLMTAEAISREPVTPTNVEYIDDVYKALREAGWKLQKYRASKTKQANLLNNSAPSTYLFEGDVQGVGLRKTLHQLLDQRHAEGLAYNDARKNQALVTLGGNPKTRDKVLRDLKNYLDAREAKYNLSPLPGVAPQMKDVVLDQNAVQNFVRNQGFTGMPESDPQWRYWLMERYRLKPNNGYIMGKVPELAAHQLEGKEPVYAYQLPGHPDFAKHKFIPRDWSKAAWWSSLSKGITNV